jgi:hypothetical protein
MVGCSTAATRVSGTVRLQCIGHGSKLYRIVNYGYCVQPVQANGTNPNISRKRTILVKYSIGRKSAYYDSFVKA